MGWLWDDRLAEVWAWPGAAGSGVGFGARGVLTVRHVVAQAMNDYQSGRVLARLVRRGATSSVWVPMRVVADDSDWDLAVLEVDPAGPQAVDWTPPGSSSPTVGALGAAAEVGCEAVGFPDEDVQYGDGGGPAEHVRQTEQVWGTLLPMGQAKPPVAPRRRLPEQWMPLDVFTATPTRQTGWGGMSGAGVLLRDGRLVGMVAAAEGAHQQRRLYVVPLDLALTASPRLADALASVAGGSVVVGSPHPGATVWPVRRMTDPFALEVHRAIDSGATASGLPVLPRYVERDLDAQLRVAVALAAGGRSVITVLVGGSSTGKTRACWEAIRSLPDRWTLWHPIDSRAAVNGLPEIGSYTVVWLNEIHRYLLSPAIGEEVAAGLREVLRDPARVPVLMLGTTWPVHWTALTAESPADPRDPHAQSRQLLAGADIAVPEAFTGAALNAVREAAGFDPRLAEALAHARDGQITQFLAGTPVLLDRYRHAPPAARAIIDAAIDARRLGHGLALPHALLAAAAPAYLSDQQWDALDDDWLDQGLNYSAASSRGTPGPLTRIRPRPGQPSGHPRYRLADYLEQAGPAARPVPGVLWEALQAYADRDDLVRLAGSASRRGLYRHAFGLYAAAADAGDSQALEGLARLMSGRERHTEAITWLTARAEPRALYWAAWLSEPEYLDSTMVDVVIRGSAEEALALYERAAEAGDADAAREAARSLAELGRPEEALAWLLPRVDTDDIGSLEEAVRLLEEVGRDDEARPLQQRADAILATYLYEQEAAAATTLARLRPRAEAGDVTALREVAEALWKADSNSAEAITFYRRAAEAGDTGAWWNAAWLMENAGRRGEAMAWLTAGIEAGHSGALYPAAQMLEREGRIELAVSYYRRAAEAGRHHGWEMAGRLLGSHAHALRAAGQTAEALSAYQQAAELGNTNARMWAVTLLEKSGRSQEAIVWLRDRLDKGEIDAAVPLGPLLDEAGRSRLLGDLRARAENGDVPAMRSAATLLDDLHRTDEALALYLRLAGIGETDALENAARLLSRAGRDEEEQNLRRYGLEPSGRVAARWTLE